MLTAERLAHIDRLGWRPDPALGNFVQTFPPKAPSAHVAAQILQLLVDGYDADAAHLEVRSDRIAREPFPPRNGPSQSLAGMINDAPSMAAMAVHACAYLPAPGMGVQPASLATAI
jgi:hypothetical protein